MLMFLLNPLLNTGFKRHLFIYKENALALSEHLPSRAAGDRSG
jgi:hypothetical protein